MSGAFRCNRCSYYLCGIFIVVLIVPTGRAVFVDSEKQLHVVDPARIGDPVIITNVSVAGKPVECGLFLKGQGFQPVTPFQAVGNWLQSTTISLFNRTNKVIVGGTIQLHFLDTGDCRATACASATIAFGQPPAIDAYDERTRQPLKADHPGNKPLDWRPVQQYVLNFNDHMEDIEHSPLADLMAITDVTRVNVYRGTFYFADGMRWVLGRFSVPDPKQPGKFDNLAESYFPGARGRNFPPEQ